MIVLQKQKQGLCTDGVIHWSHLYWKCVMDYISLRLMSVYCHILQQYTILLQNITSSCNKTCVDVVITDSSLLWSALLWRHSTGSFSSCSVFSKNTVNQCTSYFWTLFIVWWRLIFIPVDKPPNVDSLMSWQDISGTASHQCGLVAAKRLGSQHQHKPSATHIRFAMQAASRCSSTESKTF